MSIARENPTIKEITMAFVFQYEITVSYHDVRYTPDTLQYVTWGSVQEAIESIIFAHIFSPLPNEIRVVGKGYVLHGSEPRFMDFDIEPLH